MMSGLIITIGGGLSLYFSSQLFSTVQLFVTTTLPRIKTATRLQQTALSIKDNTQELSMAGEHEELVEIHGRLDALVDNLETLTAAISQGGVDIDILSLNWTSQAIRTQSQLVFQMKAQELRLIRDTKQKNFKIHRKLAGLPTFFVTPGKTGISTEWQHKALHNHILELVDILHCLETAQTREQVGIIEKQYKKSRVALLATTSSGVPGIHQQIIKETRDLLTAMDPMFNLRIQHLQIDKNNREFIAELEKLVKQLTQFSMEYVNTIFNYFKESAREVIQGEEENLRFELLLIISSILMLYILYKRIIIHGFGDRLTLISRAMIDVPGKEKEKIALPTEGQDEIADMARTVEILLEKAERLKSLATIDELTQIYNRRSFFEMAARERDRATRKKTPTSIIMMDLDHFKSVNDRFGHSFGDKVLREFARTCKKLIRSHDILARYGGEEFVLLMPETSLEEGRMVAERIRKSIETLRLTTDDNKTATFSISLGLTEAAHDGPTLEQAINRADEALYQSKEKGRNRVTTWRDDSIPAQ